MQYKVIEVFSGQIEESLFEKIKDFCRLAYSEQKHEARDNMVVEGWQNQTSSLLYLLQIEKRFMPSIGGLQLLLTSDNAIVAVSGYYRSDFHPSIYIMGVRSWVLKEHRFNLLIAQYLLPYQLEKIKARAADAAIISFNESTSSFAKLIERSNKNSDAPLKFFFGENYPDIYKDMRLWKDPVKIKNVKQWILIKKLSQNEFDWNSIRWTD
ncbi:hypothetical protein K2P97_07150 [bacterium]|nr:hypothetical protein [bacterium]